MDDLEGQYPLNSSLDEKHFGLSGQKGPDMDHVISELEKLEATRFSANSYRGLPDAPAFEIASGHIPAIVSAPHAVTHFRNGNPKPSDDYTGAMALVLAKLTGCHSIVASRFDECDPNWDPLETSKYKQELVEHVRENGIKFCLDIHGMVTASPALVELGTGDGASVETNPEVRDIAEEILSAKLAGFVELYGKPIVVDGEFAARNPNTVSRTVSKQCGIPCLQIEMATPMRVPWTAGGGIPEGEHPFKPESLKTELSARENPNPEAVFAMIQALAQIITNCL
ncbi:MAG: hypothetical protein ACOYIK_08255 [Coriobacteriales bacterium]|jgi:hypothetical protein